jgi:hypothetical protein
MRLTARQDGRKIDGPLMNSLPENGSSNSRICGYFFTRPVATTMQKWTGPPQPMRGRVAVCFDSGTTLDDGLYRREVAPPDGFYSRPDISRPSFLVISRS